MQNISCKFIFGEIIAELSTSTCWHKFRHVVACATVNHTTHKHDIEYSTGNWEIIMLLCVCLLNFIIKNITMGHKMDLQDPTKSSDENPLAELICSTKLAFIHQKDFESL